MKEKISELLQPIENKPFILVAPATTWTTKHWNKDNWRKVVDAIKDKCTLVFTGGACDNDLISYISQGQFLNLAGKTSIKDLIELNKVIGFCCFLLKFNRLIVFFKFF